MPSKLKQIAFRCTDETLIEKLDYIGKKVKRSRGNLIESILCDYVDKYEEENGTININGDVNINGNVTINNG